MYKESNLERIKILTNEVETLKEEKDVVDGKLARLLKSSKDLENIIESQRSEKKDLSWTGLPEFVDDTVTDYSMPLPTVASTLGEDQNKDTSTSEDVASTNPPKPFVKFVKPKDSQPESKSKEQETPKKSQVKYPEQNRHSNKRPKGNQRNWNNLKSYQLGLEFVLHKKPCYNCGDFSHLANDCRRRVQKETNRSQNHSYKSSTHRSASHRPNGAHMRPPHRSSGPRPHRDSMRPTFRPAGHRPHGPSMNP
nr:ubiquitin hydrolase [Tanacetum cinerariifolium]